MDDRYASALAAAAASKANLGGSPNGGGSEMVNLQNLAALQFAAGNAQNAIGAFGADAKATADREEAQKRAAAAAAEQEQKKKDAYDKILAELKDPKNYRKELNDKGGYDFYNPMGDKISVQEYSQVKDEQISDILKDSQDANDQDFVRAYKQTMELGQKMTTGDGKGVQKMLDNDPALKDRLTKLNIKGYSDYVDNFRKAYPTYFSQAQADNQKALKTADVNLQNPENKFRWWWEQR